MSDSKQTQDDMVLDALKKGDRLTPLDALNRFKCMRLGARIWNLRHKRGLQIESKKIRTESGKHVSEYWLPKQGELFR